MNFWLLVVGLVLGYASHRWSNRAAALIVLCVVLSLLWGALMAESILSGTLWALVNLAVGIGIAAAIRRTLEQAGDGPIGGA
jgi:hypothetical protein